MNEDRLSQPAIPNRPAAHPIMILAIIVAAMYFAREVLIPLAFALTLTLIWSPPVTWLQKLRIRRAPAVLTVVVLSLAVAGNIGWVILNQILAVVNELPNYQQNIHNKIGAVTSRGTGSLGRAAENVKRLQEELSTVPNAEPSARSENDRMRNSPRRPPGGPVPVQIIEKPGNNLDYLRDVGMRFVRPLGECGIVVIFSIFLLIERQDVRNRLLRLAGLSQLSVVTHALDDATQRVSRYLMLQFAVNAAFGLTIGTILYIIGLPYAALWGTIAGFVRIVPYVGTLIAVTLPLLLSIAVSDTWLPPVLVFVSFASLELVLANWIEPRLYGAHTGVSSLAILVTTVFWTILWGPAGLILSTPLTVCVAVLGRYVPQVSFLHILLGDQPVLAAETQVYQRLLAMDREEARDVAELFLKQQTLIELYDRVFIPALTMAEQDRHKGGLDAAREGFIFLSIKEMIAEFSDYTREATPLPVEDEANASMDGVAFQGRVLCLPASDEADEIVASMLAQLLEAQGLPAIAFPAGASAHETFAFLDPQPEDVICLSALPPFAFAQARSVARQFRRKYPKTKLLVGIWGFTGDVNKASDRFEQPRPDRLLTSLVDAVNYLKEKTSPPEAVI